MVKRMVVSAVVVSLGIFAYLLSSGQKGSNLTKEEMKQLYAGWTCVNMRQCKKYRTCYDVWNLNQCRHRPDEADCNYCDEYYGDDNKYCIGPEIGVSCWRRSSVCAPTFDGQCYAILNICVFESNERRGWCSPWEECKNE